MSSNSKPPIAIVGALSKQGRSVACTLLQSGRYRLCALTRRVDAPEAQNLALRGAVLMTLPLEVGHKGELVNAFRGSQGVFLMTPPIEPPETHEMEIGKQQADAAVEAGGQHMTFSALENVEKITDGKNGRRTSLSTFPSGLPGIALLLLRASWPIVVFFARIIAPLATAIQFAGAWVAPLGSWRSKPIGYCGKTSGVVNLLSGDNATFLLVVAPMAGVAISDRAFESMASAIH
jgi:NmrA-like family protein